MRAFDRLPPDLRAWLSHAARPWRPASVRRAYERALKRTGDPAHALAELDRIEAAKLARDAPWIGAPESASTPVIKT